MGRILGLTILRTKMPSKMPKVQIELAFFPPEVGSESGLWTVKDCIKGRADYSVLFDDIASKNTKYLELIS